MVSEQDVLGKQMSRGEEILGEHQDMIDAELKRVFENHNTPGRLYDMMKYHLGWLDEGLKPVEHYRGKRLRPTLCLLTYNSLSGVYDKALPAAAAVELIHNFSLIHDDIQDMDEERRHKPTVWKLWGVPQAINVGDGMHVLSNLAVLRLSELNISGGKIAEVMRVLNNTVMELCEGQYLDMSYEARMDITTAIYLEMISKKTAALIEAATRIGAIMATNDPELIGHFERFGRKIGLAFQIVDDIIGIWEPAEQTGKPSGSDIRNKKKTLPVIYAFQEAGEDRRKRLMEIYGGEVGEGNIEEVLNILREAKAYEYSQNMAKKLEDEALEELEKTGIENDAMLKLKDLARFLVGRTY
ncbi:MAG: polyprenyl synthetase family protein [Candidatus Hydrothermarchaeaceae archaeon]